MAQYIRRRRKIINVATQSQIFVETFAQVLIFFILTTFITYLRPFTGIFSSHSALEHETAFETFLSMNLSKWPLFVLIFSFLFILNILFSHRIAGPIYKIKMVINAYKAKDFRPRMTLRKTDYFKGIIPVINDMRNSLSHDIESLKIETMRAQTLLQQGAEQKRLKKSLDSIAEILEQYQLQSQDTMPSFSREQLAKASFRQTQRPDDEAQDLDDSEEPDELKGEKSN